MSRFKLLPRPTQVIAVVALILAVGGGSFAVAASLSKSDVKKIADKEIKKKAPNLSVKKAKKATTATSADSAGDVNGTVIHHFFVTDPTNTSLHDIVTFGPLTLSGGCGASDVRLSGKVNQTSDVLTYIDAGSSNFGDAQLGAGTAFSLSNGALASGGMGESDFQLNNKTYVHVDWRINDAPALGNASQCAYSGTVTVG
jgi:hypothetical protein